MVEEILPNLYRIATTLPRSPLKAINSYLVKDGGRCLLIDTAMNRPECLAELSASLAELGVDLKKTDFFITHLHADHLGLVADFAKETSKVYFNEIEATIMNPDYHTTTHRPFTDAFYYANGFSDDEMKKALEQHPGRRYGLKARVNFSIMKEGDRIEIGDYSFRCIETPGHSPGHCCLYETKHKILVSGDHILFDITPNITWWRYLKNSLGQYLASLEKVYSLDVALVLPGHRSLWKNHRERITALRVHHQNRLNEAFTALKDGAMTAYQVAPNITWDIECSSWETFPIAQKWFAVGETIAHLQYLEAEGKIRSETKDGRIFFSRA